MKSNHLIFGLTAVLLCLCVLGALMALWHFFAVKELERIQGQLNNLNQVMTAVQNLANESVLYSRQNRSIDPILQEFNLKQPAGAAQGLRGTNALSAPAPGTGPLSNPGATPPVSPLPPR